MIAIITADIIKSGDYNSALWVPMLKKCLDQWGKSPNDWEIYRGDEIQLKTTPEEALLKAVQLKATVRTIKGLDIRIAIGIGDETYKGSSVSESNGTAYQRSGRTLTQLKKNKVNLMLSTANEGYNQTMNLMLKLASEFMDDWSPVSAEIVLLNITMSGASQQELAAKLEIKQSAVSQRQKRARWSLMEEVLTYYNKTLHTIKNDGIH